MLIVWSRASLSPRSCIWSAAAWPTPSQTRGGSGWSRARCSAPPPHSGPPYSSFMSCHFLQKFPIKKCQEYEAQHLTGVQTDPDAAGEETNQVSLSDSSPNLPLLPLLPLLHWVFQAHTLTERECWRVNFI